MISAEKIRKIVISIVILALVFGLVGLFFADYSAKKQDSEKFLQFENDTRELVARKLDLEVEYANIEKIALDKLENGSYVGLLFSEINKELYKKVSAEDACTYENLIGDNCTPESKYSLQEDIREGKKVLLAKLAFLSKDSCRTLAFLSGHLNIAPRIIAKFLLKKGIEATFDAMRKYTAETCEIPVTELKKVVNTENLKRDPFKLSSNDEKIIADKISHLRNYGNDIISSMQF